MKSDGEFNSNKASSNNNPEKSIIKNKKILIKYHNYTSVIDSLNALEFAYYNASPEKIVRKSIRLNSHFTINDIHNYHKTFDLENSASIFIISVGKASLKMLTAILELFKVKKIKKIILIMPEGQSLDYGYCEKHFLGKEKIIIIKSSHPIPNKNSLDASKLVIQFLTNVKPNDMVIFLISGGTSSLLVSPIHNLTLNDKKKINHLLINCGANIREINIVRKHLSNIKGGKILKYLNNRCCVIGLILSDVVGDYVDTIGSGLTSFDESTFLDARSVLEKYSLINMNNIYMKKVRETINLGINAKLPETLKFKEFTERGINNFIIGNNYGFCELLIRYFRKFKYDVKYLGSEYDKQLSEFIDDSKDLIEKYLKKNSCILIGGEITNPVNKKKIGRGGRNQESICHLIDFFYNCQYDDYSIIFIGTDGIDGNSKAAGGLITPKTIDFLKRKQIDARDYIRRHDSYNLLLQLQSNIFTGYTGTNFNDIYLFVRKS